VSALALRDPTHFLVAARATARRNPTLVAGTVLLGLIAVVAIAAPVLVPYPGDRGDVIHAAQILQAPSASHLFGTDLLGRDLLSRVMFGARLSLLIVLVVLSVSTVVGLAFGLIAGYAGGVVDQILMRITDIFLAFPPLLLALAIAFVLGPSVVNMTIAITVTWWPWYARLARGEAASVATRGYVQSCKALGLRRKRVLLRHILPNSITPLLVQVSLDASGVLLTAAAISFLGLGAQEPTPEWGLMVSEGQQYFMTQWWLVTFPGLAILLTALAFNLIGDGLREAFDPRRIFTR
jgi:peptide/nickel transport system permease protein